MVFIGNEEKKCVCSEKAIQQYMNKISGPLLDRIDIQIEVPHLKYQYISKTGKEETSEEVKKRVNNARSIQRQRYKEEGIYCNAELTPRLIEKYCKLDKKGTEILQLAFQRLGLSARAYSRILKVARTIADIEESKQIMQSHIAEAIQYRNLDKNYWKH